MAEAKTITFIITRQDRRDSAPYEETFKIPYRPNMNVISALMEIRKNPVNADGKKTNPIHWDMSRSEEHTSELQSRGHLVCRLLLEKKKKKKTVTSILRYKKRTT